MRSDVGEQQPARAGCPDTPVTVVAGDSDSDNLLLLCAGGRKVLTNDVLLSLASPDVLRAAVELAARAAGHGQDTNTSRASRAARAFEAEQSDAVQLELPVREDDAGDWLLALRLLHPAVRPQDRPGLDWASAMRVLHLADKYCMRGLMGTCEKVLAQHLCSSSGGALVADAPFLLRSLSTAKHLGLRDLDAACCDCIRNSLRKAHAGTLGSTFLRQLSDWLGPRCHLAGAVSRAAAPSSPSPQAAHDTYTCSEAAAAAACQLSLILASHYAEALAEAKADRQSHEAARRSLERQLESCRVARQQAEDEARDQRAAAAAQKQCLQDMCRELCAAKPQEVACPPSEDGEFEAEEHYEYYEAEHHAAEHDYGYDYDDD